METEFQPLLQRFPEKRKHICRRIPKEVTITSTVVGLFLFVVTMLLVKENVISPSDENLSLAEDVKDITRNVQTLLASPMKSKDKFKDKKNKNSSKEMDFPYEEENEDKSKDKKKKPSMRDSMIEEFEEMSKNQSNVDKQSYIEKLIYIKWRREWLQKFVKDKILPSSESQEEENENEKTVEETDSGEKDEDSPIKILGSAGKFNKKILDNTWQDKKEKFRGKKEPSDYNWNKNLNLLKTENEKTVEETDSGKKDEDSPIKILGSPCKFNKKILDNTWQDKKEKLRGKKEPSDYSGNKNLNLLKTGSPSNDETKTVNNEPENSISNYHFKEKSNNYKYDNIEKGWKTIGHSSAPSNDGTKTANSEPQNSISNTHFKEKSNNYKYDNIDKGWKKNGHSIEAPSVGCPFRPTKPSAADLAMQQAYLECAFLVEEMMKTNGKCIDLSFLPKECKPELSPKCFTRYKYRTYDGSCNNRIHPTWGKSHTPFVRMLAPSYGDGVSSFRKAKSGNELPLARYLSQKLFSTKLKPDIDVSMLILIFGLFVDHDMIETDLGYGSLPCCDSDAWKHPSQKMMSECLQIEVPPDDPFYGPRNITCINLKRSSPVQGECIGRREQMDRATSFIDASTIYGSDADSAKPLRSYRNGQLRTQKINNAFFPANKNFSDISCGGYPCFASGDRRANMLTELTVMHILWYREHNRLAEELHKINPYWNDERLFQEARRLVIAQIQHITYSDWLKTVLGNEAMDYFDLTLNEDEPYEGYDETLNPTVYNVMAAAALRFGHSFIQEDILLIGPHHNTTNLMLHFTYFNVSLLHNKGLDWILRGASQQKVHTVDSFITKDARTKLFPFSGHDYGFDLASLGIQRSRDHGIPPYTKWRTACGLSEVKSWDDLNDIMDPYRAQMLREAYEDVDDIDFIPAALAENHVAGTMIGPTHLCLIGRQFKKTRHGDRFWFEGLGTPSSFTKDQLDEIYKSNIARAICDNSDGITEIQKHPFFVPSERNPIVNCEEIPSIDLSKWKE